MYDQPLTELPPALGKEILDLFTRNVPHRMALLRDIKQGLEILPMLIGR